MKIAVIGYSGAGKSTLAKFLSETYGLPLLYLDKVHWLPDWTERARTESAEIVEKFLDENENWVIDGNYGKLHFERRMREADKIVFLDFNRFTCLRRAFARKRQARETARESMTEGCQEKIDAEFFFWLVFKGRTKNRRKTFSHTAIAYPEKFVRLKNQKQTDMFKEKIQKETKEK